jgi:hypothetical protein
VLTGAVRGGWLVEPPLIEKGGVDKNDSCSSVILFLNIGNWRLLKEYLHESLQADAKGK